MQTPRRWLFGLLILATLLCPQIVLADGMILPFDMEIGYLVVPYHRVTVDIEDTHATTRVEQAFHNPHDYDVTARYLFPVPPEAMLTTFEATFDGRPQTVERQDAVTTNATLYDLVAERHDPSLLQYADWETLTFEVTVPAGDTRTMTLAYEEVLSPKGGMLHYRYVLSSERYTSDLLDEVSVTVNLNVSGGLGTLYSSSHPIVTERTAAGQAQVSWHAEHVQPTEDFHLFFAPAEGGFGSGLLTGRLPETVSQDDGDRDHFLFLFSPDTIPTETVALPKDIVFVIDRSGSMSGEKIVQAQDALQFILGQLNDQDRFSIVGFDDRLDVFANTLQSVDPDTLSQARAFVEGLTAREATDLDAALARGLEILRDSRSRPEATRLVIVLTDGIPTAGITDPYEIVERARRNNARVEARLHVFGVGYDVNTHLLDRLGEENGGSITYVQPGENLELVLTEFYRRVANPVLTDLSITFRGLEAVDLHPRTLPDMFSGSSLLLSGRYRPTADQVTVTITGRAGEQAHTFTYTFDLAETGDHAFVPRLWATRQIGLLLDTVRVEGETEALVEEIRRLGMTYGLVTPYTTFVIAAQTGGMASLDNMALYQNQRALNQAFGQITIQARVQNQSYQQAAQANLAIGANVTQSGFQNLAQIATQHVDLALLQEKARPDTPLNAEWITDNIQVDRKVTFGSEAYFDLARDPEARAFLQAGNNVLFHYQGEVIEIWDEHAPEASFDLPAVPSGTQTMIQQNGLSNVAPFHNRAQPGQTQMPQIQAPGILIQIRETISNFVTGILRIVAR